MNRPTLWASALVFATALGASTSGRVLAQTSPAVPIDCGPFRVMVGDLVALNVGNAGRAPQAPVVVQLRILDADGGTLADRSLTLSPGQSRSVAVRHRRGGLVRGEVEPVSPPDDLRLEATMQVPTRAGGLTYGPVVECAGPTANRGPV